MDQVLDVYKNLPPISRTVATAALGLSVLVYTGLLSFYHIGWHASYLWKIPPEIWRLPTSFLLTGNGLSIIYDTYFLYRYLSELEVGNPRFSKREDVVWYIIFVAMVIVTITELAWRYTPLLQSPYHTFIQGLISAACYTSHQDMRGRQANFFFFTVPAQVVPYCMILMNLVQPQLIFYVPLQFSGIIAAHLYDFFTRLWPEFGGGQNILPTPGFLSSFVTPRSMLGGFGTASTRSSAASGRSTGLSSGPLPDSWRSRGAGHRLGGE